MAPGRGIARSLAGPRRPRNRPPGAIVRTGTQLLPVLLIAIIAVGGLVAMPTDLDRAIDAQAIARHADDLAMARVTAALIKTFGTCMDYDVPTGDWMPACVVVGDPTVLSAATAPPRLVRERSRPPSA